MGYKPGQSGNPTGRPKKREDLQARCVKAVDDAVVDAWIAEVTMHGDDWVKCSELLVAYAYGRPSQKLEHSGAVSIAVVDPYAEPAADE